VYGFNSQFFWMLNFHITKVKFIVVWRNSSLLELSAISSKGSLINDFILRFQSWFLYLTSDSSEWPSSLSFVFLKDIQLAHCTSSVTETWTSHRSFFAHVLSIISLNLWQISSILSIILHPLLNLRMFCLIHLPFLSIAIVKLASGGFLLPCIVEYSAWGRCLLAIFHFQIRSWVLTEGYQQHDHRKCIAFLPLHTHRHRGARTHTHAHR